MKHGDANGAAMSAREVERLENAGNPTEGIDRWDCLTVRELSFVAQATARKHGLPVPKTDDIARMVNSFRKMPFSLIRENENGRLWVDRYYVAYENEKGDVRYTYCTKHHMLEEERSYRYASKLRRTRIEIPGDVRRCFETAKKSMKARGEAVWVEAVIRRAMDSVLPGVKPDGKEAV